MTRSYIDICLVVSEMKIFKVFYIVSPNPWRLCFLMNHDGLNNLHRGLQKEHFVESHKRNIPAMLYNIFKSVQWFLTRRFLKFSI